MTKLSPQEINYLRNPEYFKPGYQRVLSHRINKKVSNSKKLLNYVDKHERAMVTQGKRQEYDKETAYLKKLKEEAKNRAITVFTPSVRQRARQIERDLYSLSNKINRFSNVLKNHDMTISQKKKARLYVKQLKNQIDKQFVELDAVFKAENELIE